MLQNFKAILLGLSNWIEKSSSHCWLLQRCLNQNKSGGQNTNLQLHPCIRDDEPSVLMFYMVLVLQKKCDTTHHCGNSLPVRKKCHSIQPTFAASNITSIQNNHEQLWTILNHHGLPGFNREPHGLSTGPNNKSTNPPVPNPAHRITVLGQNGAVRLGCDVEMGEEIIIPGPGSSQSVSGE